LAISVESVAQVVNASDGFAPGAGGFGAAGTGIGAMAGGSAIDVQLSAMVIAPHP
jgi:hypothetical protein